MPEAAFAPPSLESHAGPVGFAPPPLDSHSGPAERDLGDQRGFWESLADKINPVPAIKEWLNRPSQIGAAMDALHVTREAAMRNPANKGKLPGQWVSSPETELTAEEKTVAEKGFNAHLPAAEGNLVSELGSPAVEAAHQAGTGNLKGAAGTLTGAYGVPVLAGKAIPKVIEAAPAVASALADTTKAVGSGIKAAAPGVAGGIATAIGGEALAQIPFMEWPARIAMGIPAAKMVAAGLKTGAGAMLAELAKRRAAAAQATEAANQAARDLAEHNQSTSPHPVTDEDLSAVSALPASRQLPPAPRVTQMPPVTEPEPPADTSGPIPTDPVTGRPLDMGPAPAPVSAASAESPGPSTGELVTLDEIARSLAQKPFSTLTKDEQATVQKIHDQIHGNATAEPEASPSPSEPREPGWWKTPEEKAAGQQPSAPAPSAPATPGQEQNAPASQANVPTNPSPTSRVVIHPGEFAPVKLLSEEGLNKYATDNGVSVDEAKQMLSGDGYQILDRQRINRALHGIGFELGMDHDTLSDVAKIQFRVKSMTQLSQEDMLALYENLQNKRSASQPLINKGDLPEALQAQPQPSTPQPGAQPRKVSPPAPPLPASGEVQSPPVSIKGGSGENIPPAQQPQTPKEEQQVLYHGTTHAFDKFSTNELGTHFGSLDQAQTRLNDVARLNQTGEAQPRIISATLKPGARWIDAKDLGSWDNLPDVVSATALRDVLTPRYMDAIRSARKNLVSSQENKYAVWENGTGSIPKDSYDAYRNPIDQFDKNALGKIRQALIAKGYTGIRYPNAHEGQGFSYSVFDPHSAMEIQSEPTAQQPSAAQTPSAAATPGPQQNAPTPRSPLPFADVNAGISKTLQNNPKALAAAQALKTQLETPDAGVVPISTNKAPRESTTTVKSGGTWPLVNVGDTVQLKSGRYVKVKTIKPDGTFTY
jgi:hypothetical protein